MMGRELKEGRLNPKAGQLWQGVEETNLIRDKRDGWMDGRTAQAKGRLNNSIDKRWRRQ